MDKMKILWSLIRYGPLEIFSFLMFGAIGFSGWFFLRKLSAVAMFLTLKSTKVPFKDRVLASLIMIAFFFLPVFFVIFTEVTFSLRWVNSLTSNETDFF